MMASIAELEKGSLRIHSLERDVPEDVKIIFVGSFTMLLYVIALFLFRKSEKLTGNHETGIAS